MTQVDVKRDLLKSAKEYNEKIIEYRRYLHQNPELGFELTATKEFVKSTLQSMGYQVSEVGKCGLVTLAGDRTKKKTILLRADMDALNIEEETDLEYKSTNGNMHACGHDMHTAMLLGAAYLLKKYEEQLEGQVKLVFQPAEEIFEGAKNMIEEGVLENPSVDAALMLHVTSAIEMEPGTVIISDEGVSAAAADIFTIEVEGKGCHGSSPENGIDTIGVMAHIVMALSHIKAMELPANKQAVISLGKISAGNVANVIPQKGTMSGSIRCFDEEVRAFIKNRIERVAKSTADIYNANAKVSFDSGCPTLVNDGKLSAMVKTYAKELLGNEMVFSTGDFGNEKNQSKAASEDFAYFSHKIPVVMSAIAAGKPSMGYTAPLHNSKVKFDEEALCYGASYFAYLAIKWLKEKREEE